jgi:hypothetical protein
MKMTLGAPRFAYIDNYRTYLLHKRKSTVKVETRMLVVVDGYPGRSFGNFSGGTSDLSLGLLLAAALGI